MSWIAHWSAFNASTVNAGGSWTTVYTKTITVSAGDTYMLMASWYATAGVSAGSFRFTLDGTPLTNTMTAPVGGSPGALHDETTIGNSGSHTIVLECNKGALGSLSVDGNSGLMFIERVTS